MGSTDHSQELNYLITKITGANPEMSAFRPHRQTGLGSFLTRFFYLGQIFVAQQFLSGAAHAALADDSAGDANDASPTGDRNGAGNDAASELGRVAAGDDSGGLSMAAAGEANPIGGKLPVGAGQHDGTDAGAPFQSHGLQSGGGSGGDLQILAQEEAREPAISGGDSAPNPGESPGVISIDPGPEGGISLDIDLGNLLNLDLDVSLLAGTVGDTVASLIGGVDAVVGKAVAELSHVVDGLTDPLAETLGTVHGALGSTLGFAIATGSRVLEGSAGVGDVGSAGVISLQWNTGEANGNSDTLFAGGLYTDLNIAMRLDAGAPDPLSDVGHTTSSLAKGLLGDAHDADSADIGSDQDHWFHASIIPESMKSGPMDLLA